MKNKNYVCHMPYLRNSIAYDHDFWCTVKNDDISMRFFHFFKILIFQVVCGIKGEKMAQNGKKFCHAPYLRNYTSYDCHFRYICVK